MGACSLSVTHHCVDFRLVVIIGDERILTLVASGEHAPAGYEKYTRCHHVQECSAARKGRDASQGEGNDNYNDNDTLTKGPPTTVSNLVLWTWVGGS